MLPLFKPIFNTNIKSITKPKRNKSAPNYIKRNPGLEKINEINSASGYKGNYVVAKL